jgi:hypothetical protein
MLGRRVWAEKDIYLEKVPEDLAREKGGKSEKMRLKISRDDWKSIVNFSGGIERNHRDQMIRRTPSADEQGAAVTAGTPTSTRTDG